MYRLAIVTSHPIQYQAPLFREIAANSEIDLTVYFRKKIGVEAPLYDRDFGMRLQWDIPLLEGYKHAFVRSAAQFMAMIKRKKPDALMLYGWNSFLNIFALLQAKSLGIPVFLYGENPLCHEFKKNRFKIFIKKLWLKFLFLRASAFLYIGEENKKFYQFYGVPENKLFFMPYAVHNERFMKAAQALKNKKRELRQRLGIKKDDFVILFVGKLIGSKRPLDLVKAYELPITNHQLPIIHLVFVGDGELKPKLENYAKKKNLRNVYFTGFQNQTKVPLYYAMADILVLPSGIPETWGLVVNEAMCFGLPVIVSDMVGCAFDLVRNGENGFIYPLGDTDALASHLEMLCKDSERRNQFGEKSFEIITEYSYAEDVQGIREAFCALPRLV